MLKSKDIIYNLTYKCNCLYIFNYIPKHSFLSKHNHHYLALKREHETHDPTAIYCHPQIEMEKLLSAFGVQHYYTPATHINDESHNKIY